MAREGLGLTHPTDFVSSFGKSAIKQYIVYDGSDRPTQIYEAASGCLNGESCLLTEYTYSGVSSRVVKMKESVTTWVTATMDI